MAQHLQVKQSLHHAHLASQPPSTCNFYPHTQFLIACMFCVNAPPPICLFELAMAWRMHPLSGYVSLCVSFDPACTVSIMPADSLESSQGHAAAPNACTHSQARCGLRQRARRTPDDNCAIGRHTLAQSASSAAHTVRNQARTAAAVRDRKSYLQVVALLISKSTCPVRGMHGGQTQHAAQWSRGLAACIT